MVELDRSGVPAFHQKGGGFSAYGGISTKRRMLVIEGALADEPTLFWPRKLWRGGRV